MPLSAQVLVTYTEDGTFVIPDGVTEITIEAWGGGGAGAGRNSNGIGAVVVVPHILNVFYRELCPELHIPLKLVRPVLLAEPNRMLTGEHLKLLAHMHL